MSLKTTNYNLIKPELTDAADITATNSNWDTIDQKLHTAETGLGELTTEVEGKADANEHIYKTYRFPSELGLTDSTVTMAALLTALPTGSMINIAVDTTFTALDVPTKYGSLTVIKSDLSRAYAIMAQVNSENIWYCSSKSTTHEFGSWKKLNTANITYGTAEPTGGNPGDIYIQYEG